MLSEKDLESILAEGAALSTEEAIAYAQHGRGERKHPTSGWASLTPAERDVVRRVNEIRGRYVACRLRAHPKAAAARGLFHPCSPVLRGVAGGVRSLPA
jgi:hypothetical protein